MGFRGPLDFVGGLKEAVDTPYIAHQAYVYITMDSMGGGIHVAGARALRFTVRFLPERGKFVAGFSWFKFKSTLLTVQWTYGLFCIFKEILAI